MKARRRAVVALGLAWVLLVPGTASAHDQLVDSAPGYEERLTDSPHTIRLTYSGDLLQLGTAVVVADQDERTWPTGEVEYDGPDVTVDLTSQLPDGHYQVRWRVVSSDGHPISGVVPFVVGTPAPVAADGPADDGGPGATGVAGATVQDAVQDAAQADTAATTGGPGWLRTVLVGAGGAGTALLLLVVSTRWRTPSPQRTAGDRRGASRGDEP